MWKTSLTFHISLFRHRVFVWTILTIFSCSFLPSLSTAQQPTARISALKGNVLVNGQKQGKGRVLSAGDVIETQAGTTVVLELLDGSLLELGENTKVDMAELAQTTTGARVSLVKVMWGRIRAKLSSGHQQAGSSFNIETPNALVGVKFSQPDVEVSYDPAKQETVALAITVALAVKNLITDEEKIIPVGSMVIITALGIKIMAGAAVATGAIGAETAGTGAAAAGTTTADTVSGIGTGTIIAIGTGAVAAGGIAAVAASSGDSDGISFAGIFRGEWTHVREEGRPDAGSIAHNIQELRLVQNGTIITGDFIETETISYTYSSDICCTSDHSYPINGEVRGTSANLSLPARERACRGNGCNHYVGIPAGSGTATLQDSGQRLVINWNIPHTYSPFERQD